MTSLLNALALLYVGIFLRAWLDLVRAEQNRTEKQSKNHPSSIKVGHLGILHLDSLFLLPSFELDNFICVAYAFALVCRRRPQRSYVGCCLHHL